VARETLTKVRRVAGFEEFKIIMGMFDFDMRVIMGPYKKLQGYLRKLYEDPKLIEDEEEPKGLCYRRPGWVPVVWIPRFPVTSAEYGTLSHECVHAANHMLDWGGIPRTSDTEEVVAHAVAWIIFNVLETSKSRRRTSARIKSKKTPKRRTKKISKRLRTRG
jgi:hypothetical protein